MATVTAVFRLQSELEYRGIRDEVGGFREVPFAQIRCQERGELMICAQRATDPLFTSRAQPARTRPCLVDAGGQTLIPGE